MKCNIRELRLKNSLTQRQLAVLMDTDPSTVSRWENLKQFPEFITLFKLAKILNCKIDDLYSDIV
jgi:putative transcriptional regulator